LASSRSCIHTVGPWPSGSAALRRPARRTRGRPARADIDVLGVCRDGELDLLCPGAIRGGSVLPRDGGDRSCELDVSPLQLPDAARQPHGELVIGDGDQHTRAFDARHLRDRVGKPRPHRRGTAPGTPRPHGRAPPPVAQVLCGEEVLPAPFAHVCLQRRRESRPPPRLTPAARRHRTAR
jgi:hypothetical protein